MSCSRLSAEAAPSGDRREKIEYDGVNRRVQRFPWQTKTARAEVPWLMMLILQRARDLRHHWKMKMPSATSLWTNDLMSATAFAYSVLTGWATPLAMSSCTKPGYCWMSAWSPSRIW